MNSLLVKSVGIIVVLGLVLPGVVSDFAGAQELAKEQVAVFALMGGDIGTIDPMGGSFGQDNPVRHHIYGR